MAFVNYDKPLILPPEPEKTEEEKLKEDIEERKKQDPRQKINNG